MKKLNSRRWKEFERLHPGATEKLGWLSLAINAMLLLAFVLLCHHASHVAVLMAANQFVFADWVTMESLRILLNQLEIAQFMNTDYNKEFTREFAVGETVRVKNPQRFVIRDGLGYQEQAIARNFTTVTCDQIFGIDFQWDSVEEALKMERGSDAWRREYIEPAMAQIANEIDTRAAKFSYQNLNNIVGVLGQDPNNMTVFQQARERLIEKACPPEEKGMIITPSVSTALVPALASFFNPTSEISEQYKEGSMGKLSGFDWYESVNLYRHTAGTAGTGGTFSVNGNFSPGAPSVNVANGSSLAVNAGAGETLNVGDVISIANVNFVNPMTRRTVGPSSPYGTMQFVVTAPITFIGGGNAADVVQISPAIVGPGGVLPASPYSQYQNVDALPLNGATITLFPGTAAPWGKTGAQSLALHRDAIAMVGVKLSMPKAVELSSQTRDRETGLSVRFVRMFDPIQSRMVNRFDVLMGFGTLYPDNCGVRVLCG